MNTIFKYTGPLLSENENRGLATLNVNWVAQIPEMRKGFIQADFPTWEVFNNIKALLESKGTIKVVGTWYENGLQYGYSYEPIPLVNENDVQTYKIVANDDTPKYPFDFNSYKSGLNNYQEFDVDGVITVDRGYTSIEAREKQVNRFGGRNSRDLITHA